MISIITPHWVTAVTCGRPACMRADRLGTQLTEAKASRVIDLRSPHDGDPRWARQVRALLADSTA